MDVMDIHYQSGFINNHMNKLLISLNVLVIILSFYIYRIVYKNVYDSPIMTVVNIYLSIILPCGYLVNLRKASVSDVAIIIIIYSLSFGKVVNNYYKPYEMFFAVMILQCIFHHPFWRNRRLYKAIYYSQRKTGIEHNYNDKEDSTTHWIAIVIDDCRYPIQNEYLVYHAIGDLSMLEFKKSIYSLDKIKQQYSYAKFATFIERLDVLELFDLVKIKSPFAIGAGTCQDFCIYIAQALSANIMRVLMRLFFIRRITMTITVIIFAIIQANESLEGRTMISPSTVASVMMTLDYMNTTGLYINSNHSTITYWPKATCECVICLIIYELFSYVINLLLNYDGFALILLICIVHCIIKYIDLLTITNYVIEFKKNHKIVDYL